MNKTEIRAALAASGVTTDASMSIAELRALAAEHNIDLSKPAAEPTPAAETAPAEEPAREKQPLVIFRVGDKAIDAASGRCAARSRIRMKLNDAQLHEAAGRGVILRHV